MTELIDIFSNEARVTEYNAQGGTMRQGICGWCGVMSPLNRRAFVEDFGAQTVTLAEVEARRRMEDKAKEYAATHHAAHVAEANQNERRTAAPANSDTTKAANESGTTPTEAAQAPETTTDDQQPTEAPKAQQSAQKTPKSESDGGELFTLDGETFRRGDRVTVCTVDAYDAHTSTEAGTLTGYARSQALAEVTTDDGRRVYGFYGLVKHAPTDPTPTPGGKGAEGEAQTPNEGESPVIGGYENDRICTAQDGISPDENEADAQTVAMPDTFGDLCWDTQGKASAIVFGNIDDHAAQLEALGGVRREVNYHPLRTVKARRGDRMEAYYFDKRHARNAGPYVARVNHTLQDSVWKSCHALEKQAADYEAGDRVRTIYGLGVVIDGGGLHAPSKNCVRVRLDGTTYNYGWEGMPQKFVEVSGRDMMAEGESDGGEQMANIQTADGQILLNAASVISSEC